MAQLVTEKFKTLNMEKDNDYKTKNLQKDTRYLNSTIQMMNCYNDDILADLICFCKKYDIEMEGISAYTIHINKSTEICSLIIDWNTNKILTNYPIKFVGKYKELKLNNNKLLVCYKTNLPKPEDIDNNYYEYEHHIHNVINNTNNNTYQKRDILNTFPCCDYLSNYGRRTITDHEEKFNDFKMNNSRANYEGWIFEVKEQINNGSILNTTFCQLINGERVVISNNTPMQKIHSYKNYKCTKCNLFFSIDLYKKTSNVEYNKHHMRLNPTTKNPQHLRSML